MQQSTSRLILLGLLLSMAAGFTVTSGAQDKPAPAQPNTPATPARKPMQPTQQTLSGKVVAVDKSARTVTIQINNQTYVLQLSDATKVAKGDKSKSVDDISVGEEISVEVMLRETASGRVEVVVLSVELPTTETATAQGQPRRGGSFRPFQGEPNPANRVGPFISPHR